METLPMEGTVNQLLSFDIKEIMDLIPHRYPMLMIDGLEQVVLGESAVGVKNVTVNEPFFQGHFPGNPIMPGVLIVEAMAQTAAALVMASLGIGAKNHVVYFMSISDARFRKPVVPGQKLMIRAVKEQKRGLVWRFRGEAFVGQDIVAEASYTAKILPLGGVSVE